jgi:hypothetical protein
MKRADKIRAANEAAALIAASDDRDQTQRDSARREWGGVRKSARDAFVKGGDWKSVLDGYRGGDGFYTEAERRKMCDAYSEELINNAVGR